MNHNEFLAQRVIDQLSPDTYDCVVGVACTHDGSRSERLVAIGIAADIASVLSGECTYVELLEQCIDGADPELIGCWEAYVAVVFAVVRGE